MKKLIFGNYITTIIAIVLLVAIVVLFALGYIRLDVLIGFVPFPLGLIFSKDKWFKHK